MATPSGRETAAVGWPFSRPPESFTFEQLLRALSLRWQDAYGGRDAFLQRGVKIIPHLSLSFPPTDIAALSIRMPTAGGTEGQPALSPLPTLPDLPGLPGLADAELPDPASSPGTSSASLPVFTVTATFLGLYGAASPLPAFYTEDLLGDEREDVTVVRDFLDIVNQVLYRKYYLAGNLSKIAFRTLESREADIIDLQYCLLGLGHEPLRSGLHSTFRDLAHIGLFAHHVHSASGLEQYLAQILGLPGVFDASNTVTPGVLVEQCVERTVPVPHAQYCRLGMDNASLGNDTVLGQQVRDVAGTFCIRLFNVDSALFRDMEEKRHRRELLERAVCIYVHDPLRFELRLDLREGALSQTRLGLGERLGVSTCLLGGRTASPAMSVAVRAAAAPCPC